VIGKASAAPTASDRILIEHPPLNTVGSDPSIDPARAAEDEPNGRRNRRASEQHEQHRAMPYVE
jgi:hypothetical protein